ncbi:MAG: hypothetical protein KC583_07255, partial [Myxococcales bacterium]|nr:hypothetical protein [Myxococcales bacterium]
MRFAPYAPDHRPFFVALFTDADTMAHVGGAMSPEAAGALFDAILAGTRPRVAHAWLVVEGD